MRDECSIVCLWSSVKLKFFSSRTGTDFEQTISCCAVSKFEFNIMLYIIYIMLFDYKIVHDIINVDLFLNSKIKSRLTKVGTSDRKSRWKCTFIDHSQNKLNAIALSLTPFHRATLNPILPGHRIWGFINFLILQSCNIWIGTKSPYSRKLLRR